MTPEDREWVRTLHQCQKAQADVANELSATIQQMQGMLKDAAVRARIASITSAVLFAELAKRSGGGAAALEEMLADLEGGTIQVFDAGDYSEEMRVDVRRVMNEIVELAGSLNVD